jgi:hypothetical protein
LEPHPKKGLLINDLELGYAPMSAYTFKQLIRDKDFSRNVIDSHLYIIAQRRELTFNNFNFSLDRKFIRFEITQEKNPEIIHCTLPVFQRHIATDLSKGVDLRFQNRENTIDTKHIYPFNGMQGIIFQEVDIVTNERRHLIWFSPEKLLQNYWKGHIELEIEGNYKRLLEYKVHYVGKHPVNRTYPSPD